MSEKLTQPQFNLLTDLSFGPRYAVGKVPGSLVNKGFATYSEHGSRVTITEAGRQALQSQALEGGHG